MGGWATTLAFCVMPVVLVLGQKLTMYWFTSNFFTLSQTLIVRKYYEQNPPEIELPEYWDQLGEDENEMTSEERRSAAKAGIAKGPSIEDWIDNAKFHTLVERESFQFRQDEGAWKPAAEDAELVIPTE